MLIEDLEKMSQTECLFFKSQPAWATRVFTISLWGETLGSILLLLKKFWARPILLLSLIGIIAQLNFLFL